MQTHRTFEVNPLALWFGILAGPIASALNEGLNYALDQHACSTGHFYVLHTISVCALLLTVCGGSAAWYEWRGIGGTTNDEGGTPRDRSGFMATLGIAASIFFALVIVAMSVPHFILSPCD